VSRTVHIGDLFEFRKGKKPGDLLDTCPDGGIKFLQIDHLRGKGSEVFVAEPKGTIANKSDICIVWDGANAGLVGYGLEGSIGSTITRLRAINENLLLIPYVAKFLQSKFEYLNSTAQGAAIPHVDGVNLKQLKIHLPPIEEQKFIAAILDKTDALCRKREQAIALTDDLLRSVFLDMFGDPVTNTKSYAVARLCEVGEVQGGLQVTSKRKTLPIELPYLRVANVYRDRLKLDEIKSIRVSEKEAERAKLFKGDILIVEGHGNPNEIGRSSVWDGSIEGCLHQNHLIRFRCNQDRVLPRYVSNFINSEGGRRQMLKAGNTTSGLNTISTKIVKETKILLPSLKEQKEYIKLTNKILKEKGHLVRAQNKIEELFSSLTQRAFRDELTAQKEVA
jgi:type I restriction enzyme, S subunit